MKKSLMQRSHSSPVNAIAREKRQGRPLLVLKQTGCAGISG